MEPPELGALLLVALAILYSSGLPFLLADRPQLRRTPKAMLWLWQCLAVAGVVSALGSGALVMRSWLHPDSSVTEVFASILAGALAATVLIRLLLTGHKVGRNLRVTRARHRELVDILGQGLGPTQAADSDLRLIEFALPIAYCLPSWRGARIVVASQAVERLDSTQLGAVLAHERAHLAGRHDLLVEAFIVLQRAFPQAIAGRLAHEEVEILIELLADRVASSTVAVADLLTALESMAELDPTRPEGAPKSGSIAARRQMLKDPPQPRPAQSLAILPCAACVAAAPVSIIIWALSH